MKHNIKLKLIEPPEKIILNHTEYCWLIELISDKIIARMRQSEANPDDSENDGTEYFRALLKKLVPYQVGGRQVELRLVSEEQQ